MWSRLRGPTMLSKTYASGPAPASGRRPSSLRLGTGEKLGGAPCHPLGTVDAELGEREPDLITAQPPSVGPGQPPGEMAGQYPHAVQPRCPQQDARGVVHPKSPCTSRRTSPHSSARLASSPSSRSTSGRSGTAHPSAGHPSGSVRKPRQDPNPPRPLLVTPAYTTMTCASCFPRLHAWGRVNPRPASGGAHRAGGGWRPPPRRRTPPVRPPARSPRPPGGRRPPCRGGCRPGAASTGSR